MSQDLHQVILRWPHTDANEVIVTGTFDQWSSSLRLARKPDGFETPISIPWNDKIAYKFIVDGRWMTNDTEPTEIDHGFVNNVYSAPSKPAPPEPKHVTILPSEPQGEPDHAEKLPAQDDKLVANGYALDEPHNVPTAAAEPAPEGPSTLAEDIKAGVAPAAEALHGAVAQVGPDSQQVEKASDEVAPEYQASRNTVPTAPSASQSNVPEPPVADGSDKVVAPVEEPVSACTPEPGLEVTQDVDAAREGGPAEKSAVPEEQAVSTYPTSEAEPPKEATHVLVGEVEQVTDPHPTSVAADSETVLIAGREAAVTSAHDGCAAVPEPTEFASSPAPAPAVEQKSTSTESADPIPAAEPAAAPEHKPDVKSLNPVLSSLPTAPAVNGHTKSTSTASTSTAVPTLPTTPIRKASRKFSFPGRDKSGSGSPTGSSRFSSQQKREKRQSLLGKLKEIFGDKEKKEKSGKA
ncbi:hypothetical protein F5148DRAFT_474272 [Russula earlei]|uniref:Uncharacterized protein n=1 Tax=Russula earlei TaxID=71964 RepID=A0ACC0UIB9_9AGAM|nr:hypothetical protein F5148DRAFT_474272 [Russula earlei]